MKNFLQKKNFSFIHNFHSPSIYYLYNKEYIVDNTVEDYKNKFIKAFLNKRRTTKKEIPPKIQIVKIKKEYNNHFATQRLFPLYYLLNPTYIIQMADNNLMDSSYWLSIFFEEFEKNCLDSMLEKIIVNGYVPPLEDLIYFEKKRKEVFDLQDIFYNGDKQTTLEKEIERAYLVLKRETYNSFRNSERNNRKTDVECFFTYSDLNKLCGIKHFRVNDPDYYKPLFPIFQTLDVEAMFNSLYYIRYNSIDDKNLIKAFIERMKLKYQYRESLIKLGSVERISYMSKYLFTQLSTYVDCYDFKEEFNFSLNYKKNFNIIIMMTWMIIRQLKVLEYVDKNTNKSINNHCSILAGELKNNLLQYGDSKILFFDTTKTNGSAISDLELLIDKIFNFYEFFFSVLPYYINKKNDNNKTNTKKEKQQSISEFLNKIINSNEKINLYKKEQIQESQEKKNFDTEINDSKYGDNTHNNIVITHKENKNFDINNNTYYEDIPFIPNQTNLIDYYQCTNIILNDILELNFSNQINIFYDNLEYFNYDINNKSYNDIEDHKLSVSDKLASDNQLLNINHISEYFISLFKQISTKSYSEIEKTDIDFTLDIMSLPIIYNNKLAKNGNNLIPLMSQLNTSSLINAIIQKYNIDRDEIESDLKEEVWNGLIIDTKDKSSYTIEGLIKNPNMSENCIEEKENAESPLLIKFSKWYAREMIVKNHVALMEQEYFDEIEGKKAEGRELQFLIPESIIVRSISYDNENYKEEKKVIKEKKVPMLGLNALIKIQNRNNRL